MKVLNFSRFVKFERLLSVKKCSMLVLHEQLDVCKTHFIHTELLEMYKNMLKSCVVFYVQSCGYEIFNFPFH